MEHTESPTPHGRIVSVNVGAGTPRPRAASGRVTGIHKRPVTGPVAVADPGPRSSTAGSGLAGDVIGDTRHHGGTDQAVYAVALEELKHWGGRLGRALPPGAFGENLTTAGYDVDGAILGERWRVGDVELQVTGPRVPCGTFRTAMGVTGWLRLFTERGRTGAYLRVLSPGLLRAELPLTVIHRPAHGVTVPVLFRALMGDAQARARVDAAGEDLSDTARRSLARRSRTADR
ncbi:sulfurase [Tersicoccus solisilvae]|uniref:Sulfurase n=1 Tax=Tersicoccus solisilvae TaxID=1882339 RepID=A0ABQ1NJU1_9MICC|nr:MOSC domain-containing protein [Tersicoccus solisilvae]GGC78832.1 sulfurase [Tersicoccus solisilvae]